MIVLVENRNGIPSTKASVISKNAQIDEESIQRLIRTHKNSLELFGEVEFDTIKTNGRPQKLYYLNEQQSYLFITFLKNTKIVKEFKIKLIQEFFRMKNELSIKVPPTQLDLITPYEVRKDLTTTRRALTIEKNKHEKTAELYNKYRKIAQEHEQTIRQLEGKVMQLQDHEVIASTVYRALQDSLELQKIKKVIQIGA